MASLFLKGEGNGKFTANTNTGMNTKGEVRKIIPVNDKTFIFLKNNAPAQTFSLK